MGSAAAQTYQAGLDLIAQQLSSIHSNAIADLLKPPAIGMELSRLFAVETQISQLSAATLINPWLEADRERREQLAELINPCRGLADGLHTQTSALRQLTEASSGTLHQIVKASAPALPSLDLGLGLAENSTLGVTGDFSMIPGLDGSLQIHAVPRLMPPALVRAGSCRNPWPDRAPWASTPEEPEQPAGLFDDNLDDQGGRRVLEQLSRFVRSEEIPSNAREGMDVLLGWWKLKGPGLSQAESHQFNLTVLGFLRNQLGVAPAADGAEAPRNGELLVPHSQHQVSAPDLAPAVYTTLQLKKLLHLSTDTLKRHARKACSRGPLPQPLSDFPDWFVVEGSDPQGGQNRGWKFQQRLTPEER